MKKYKRHIIIGSIIIAVLVFAFWWGGDAPSLRGWNVESTPKATEKASQQFHPHHLRQPKTQKKFKTSLQPTNQ